MKLVEIDAVSDNTAIEDVQLVLVKFSVEYEVVGVEVVGLRNGEYIQYCLITAVT